jgi:formate-dependent nitrite reductase membrane component NrfD
MTSPSARPPAPPIKKTPWEWYIPIYFWLGGIAAGGWLAATAEDLAGENDRAVVRAGRYLAFGGIVGGTGLLILDLGRSDRFLNMLRIVRARSAMSLGSWGLATFGSYTGAAALLQAAEDGLFGSRPHLARLSRDRLGRFVHITGLPWALFVGSYTGVLLASTSTPSWAKRGLVLGPLFLASGLSSGIAAVSATVAASGHASSAAHERLERAERTLLAAELALAMASRRRAAALPSAKAERKTQRLLNAAVLGAGVALPLVAHLAKGMASPERRPKSRPSRALVRHGRASRPASFERTHQAGRTIVTASLALLGSLALRFLVTREGKRSAQAPGDTWAFTAAKDRATARCLPIPAHVVGEGVAAAGSVGAARVT